MKVKMESSWQGFKEGDVVEVTELLARWLKRQGIAFQCKHSKPCVLPEKSSTRKPRKRKTKG
jgi:hypothetical protein